MRLPQDTPRRRAVTRAFQARLTELETLLASTLGEDPYVSFEQLKEPLCCRISGRRQNWLHLNAMDLSVFDVVGVRGAGGGREAVLVTERDVVPGAVVARAWR